MFSKTKINDVSKKKATTKQFTLRSILEDKLGPMTFSRIQGSASGSGLWRTCDCITQPMFQANFWALWKHGRSERHLRDAMTAHFLALLVQRTDIIRYTWIPVGVAVVSLTYTYRSRNYNFNRAEFREDRVVDHSVLVIFKGKIHRLIWNGTQRIQVLTNQIQLRKYERQSLCWGNTNPKTWPGRAAATQRSSHTSAVNIAVHRGFVIYWRVPFDLKALL